MAGDNELTQLDQRLEDVQQTVVELIAYVGQLEQQFESLFQTTTKGRFEGLDQQAVSQQTLREDPEKWKKSTGQRISEQTKKDLVEELKLLNEKKNLIDNISASYEILKSKVAEVRQANLEEQEADIKALHSKFVSGEDIEKSTAAYNTAKAKKEELLKTTLEYAEALEREAAVLILLQESLSRVKLPTNVGLDQLKEMLEGSGRALTDVENKIVSLIEKLQQLFIATQKQSKSKFEEGALDSLSRELLDRPESFTGITGEGTDDWRDIKTLGTEKEIKALQELGRELLNIINLYNKLEQDKTRLEETRLQLIDEPLTLDNAENVEAQTSAYIKARDELIIRERELSKALKEQLGVRQELKTEEARKPDIEEEELLAKKEPIVEEVVPDTAIKGVDSLIEKVKRLTIELEDAKQKFIELHAKAAEKATGGVATPEGVLASQQRILKDPDEWGGRVGGGARIRNKAAEEIKDEARLVNSVNKELREQSSILDGLKAKQEEVKTSVKEPVQLELETSSAEENLDSLKLKLDEVYKAIGVAKSNLEKLESEGTGKDTQSVKDEVSKIEELDKEKKELLATIKEETQAREDLSKTKQTDDPQKEIADTTKETQVIKEKTDAIDDQTQAIQKQKQEEAKPAPIPVDVRTGDPTKLPAKPEGENRLFNQDKGLQDLVKSGDKGKQAANALQEAIKALNSELDKYGDKIAKQQTSGELLANGLRKYTTSIVTAGGATRKHTQYLDEHNRVLSETERETHEAAAAAKKLATAFREIKDEGTSERRYDLAKQAAGGAGFGEGDLKSIYTQHPSGVTFFKYEMKDAMGVTQKYEVVLDKFGKELTRTNRRLLGFAESVKKNTIELIKWSVGVTLVYGTYYKFQQLLETAIDNQAKLAVVAVTLGNAQRDLNEIFDDAAKVAAATGESINAILETYTFAYRAVGAIADPIERTAKANQLLTDATILNKLSSLDAASSIDVLAGSLRQLQGPTESVAEAFDYGVDLLDKWIVTTRNANVDLASLAMAFSVTAESAMNAGMSVEELNAVIASLAEKIGGLGGRETGNAVRALIGGVYQQQATDILAKYGIAVKNTAGQMRDFLEISRDIYELYDQEIISASELNKIGLVLGGGVRRGQQYVAYLSDFGNVLELVEKQSNSSGASQQALGIIMETLQVTLTKLSNSVQNLAQTMGTEGGLLGAANSVLGVIIKLVEATDTLVGLFGKLTIPAALLGMGAGYFSLGGSIGAARRTDFSGKIGGAAQGMMSGMMGMLPYFNRSDLQNIKPVFDEAGKVSHYIKPKANLIALPSGVEVGGQTVTGKQTLPARAGAFMQENYWGMMPGMFAGISRIGEGDLTGAAITMGATMGGAWAKGPWGAIVGTIIAEVFIDGVRKAKADLTDALVSPLMEYEEGKKKEPDLGELDARREINTQQIMDAVGLPIALQIGAMFADLDAKIYQAFGAEGKPTYAPPATPTEKFLGIQGERIGYTEPGMKADEHARLALELREKEYAILKETGGYISTVTEANHLRNQALLEEADLLSSRSLNPVSAEKSSFALEMKRLNTEFGTYLTEMSTEFQKQLRIKMTQGETTTKEFQTGLAVSQGARPNVLAIQAALSVASGIAELVGEGEKLPVTEENMKEFFDLVTQASPEVVTTLTQMTSEIVSLSQGLDALEGQDATATVNIKGIDWNAEQLIESIVTLLKEIPIYAEFAQEALTKMNLVALGAPKTIMSGFEGLDTSQMDMVFAEAARIQDTQLQLQVDVNATDKWTDEWKAATEETAEPLFIYLGELFGFYLAEGISNSEYLQEALLNLQENMRIPEQDVGYRFFDVSQAQMNAIMPQYDAIRQSILAAGGTSQESALLAFFQNSSSPVYMQKDWAIIQMLLSQLLRTNTRQLKTNRDQLKAEEKQLEGIYNLPGGASFYVPFDAYAMKQKDEGGGGEMGLEEPVQEFAAAVEKMDSILDQYKNYNVESIQSMREFMDGFDKDWTEEKIEPPLPEVAPYNIEAIQSLYGVDMPKPPFETYVTNFREWFTVENLVGKLKNALQIGGIGKEDEDTPEFQETMSGYVTDIENFLALITPLTPYGGEDPIETISGVIEMYVQKAQEVLEWFKNNADLFKPWEMEGVAPEVDTGGGLSKTGEISLDNFADTIPILKGLGDNVESGVSKGMSELETQVAAGLSPTKTSLDTLVATLSHESERGYDVESIQSLMGDALSGGTITLSDITFTTPDVSTKLNMSIQVNTQLTLDGYLLWQGIKDYARADLITYAGVSGTGTTNYVI